MINSASSITSPTYAEFPLSGIGADISAGLEFVILFLSVQMFIFFLLKFSRAPKKEKIKASRNLAWAIMCLGLGLTYGIFIIGDFILEPGLREQFNTFGYLIICISAVIFLIITEYVERSKKYPFTISITIVLTVLVISIIFQVPNVSFSLAAVGFPLALIYFIYYTKKLLNLSNHSKKVVVRIRLLFAALTLILLGYTSMADIIVSNLGVIIRLIGDCASLMGTILFLYTIERLPDFTEFDWISGLQSIIVMNESGVSLFGRFYQNSGTKAHGKHMVSGGLSSVKAVLEEMTGRKKMKTVYLDDKVLHFEYRMNLTFVIITDKYYQSLAIRLEQFADEFENLFKCVLENWNGNLQTFMPAESIADRIFIPLND